MTQLDTLRALDEAIVGAFKAAGLADAAFYDTTPVDVLVDRSAQFLGDSQVTVAGQRIVVTFQLQQIVPKRGGRLTLGAESFELSELLNQDESLSTWVAVNG